MSAAVVDGASDSAAIDPEDEGPNEFELTVHRAQGILKGDFRVLSTNTICIRECQCLVAAHCGMSDVCKLI